MRKAISLSVTTAALAILAGCASPMQYSDGKVALDRDTRYSVEETPDGFTLTVAYDRYQFLPETGAVMAACRSALLATAYEVAEKKGREIEPLNEQRIRISAGRNGFSGTTSCEASVPAVWKIK